jgi:hypothetical protein
MIGVRGRPLSASQASSDSPSWSSPAGGEVGAIGEHRGDRVDHGRQHFLGVRLHPAGPWMGQGLVPASLLQRSQVGLEEHRPDR